MDQEQTKTLGFHEVEVKFRVDEGKRNDWKQLVESFDGIKEFIYVESDDIYYVKDEEFLRHRFSNHKKDKRAELTYKAKTKDGDNIIRKEVNVRVDANDVATVKEFCESLGFQRNFKIGKYVDIYKFEDATLPFYTVITEDGKRETFIEIEVDEEKLHGLTEDEAWDIIKKYEEKLAPLEITHKNRLRKSLFEMYRR